MTNQVFLNRYPDSQQTAVAASKDLALALQSLLEQKREVNLVLTGGTIGIEILRLLAIEIKELAVDTTRIHFWWGDERFVEKNSPDRNENQARLALLDQIGVNEDFIHSFPASDEMTIEEAASYFEDLLLRQATEDEIPVFDICLLGMGPDGHVASLFPGQDGVSLGRYVVIENHSPKPPPRRLSLSFEALNSANEIWLLAAGQEKAEKIAQGFKKLDASLPIAKVEGKIATRWYLDDAAASELD